MAVWVSLCCSIWIDFSIWCWFFVAIVLFDALNPHILVSGFFCHATFSSLSLSVSLLVLRDNIGKRAIECDCIVSIRYMHILIFIVSDSIVNIFYESVWIQKYSEFKGWLFFFVASVFVRHAFRFYPFLRFGSNAVANANFSVHIIQYISLCAQMSTGLFFFPLLSGSSFSSMHCYFRCRSIDGLFNYMDFVPTRR